MADKDRPIYSSRAEDSTLGEAIDQFVIRVADRIDALQDAEIRCDFGLLRSLADALIRESEEIGFSPLARCAGVITAAAEEESGDEIHSALVELTEIARRIRLGHRGSI